jgi:RHS repeat-associated protein
MQMPGRHGNTGDYRYGFNGQESDDEWTGSESHVSYTWRCYDTRLGRFLSIDPLSSVFVASTPYSFAANTPIWAFELEGAAPAIKTDVKIGTETYRVKVRRRNPQRAVIRTVGTLQRTSMNFRGPRDWNNGNSRYRGVLQKLGLQRPFSSGLLRPGRTIFNTAGRDFDNFEETEHDGVSAMTILDAMLVDNPGVSILFVGNHKVTNGRPMYDANNALIGNSGNPAADNIFSQGRAQLVKDEWLFDNNNALAISVTDASKYNVRNKYLRDMGDDAVGITVLFNIDPVFKADNVRFMDHQSRSVTPKQNERDQRRDTRTSKRLLRRIDRDLEN